MKYLLSLIILTIFISMILPNSYNENELEKHLGIYKHSKDTITLKMFQLKQGQQYDSIINLCRQGIEQRKEGQDKYYAFMATAFYYKGLKDSAYHYGKEMLIKKLNFGVDDIAKFSEYVLYTPLAFDTFFQQTIMDMLIEDYHKKQYPLSDVGEKILRLKYEDQRIRMYKRYVTIYITDSLSRNNEIQKCNTKMGEGTLNYYRDILKHHPELLTEQEIGYDAYNAQFLLILHTDKDSIQDKYTYPMMKRAMERGEILPDNYVDLLSRREWIKRHLNNEEHKRVYDSLCEIYNCKYR